MKSYIITTASLIISALTLGSCGGARRAASPESGYTQTAGKTSQSAVVNSNQTIRNQTDARVALRTALGQYGQWEKLRVPVTLSLSAPKSLSVSGTIEMERGKSVLISLRYFGIEVGWLKVTQDRVTAAYKMGRKYVEEPVAELLRGFPLNVENVQDALLGRPFVAGFNNLSAYNFNLLGIEPMDDGLGWMLLPEKPAQDIEYGFAFSADRLMALLVKAGQGEPVNVSYAPAVTDRGVMSSMTTVSALVGGKTQLNLSIEYDFNRAKFDGDAELRNVSLPAGYQRIPAASLLNLVKTL